MKIPFDEHDLRDPAGSQAACEVSITRRHNLKGKEGDAAGQKRPNVTPAVLCSFQETATEERLWAGNEHHSQPATQQRKGAMQMNNKTQWT